MFDIVILNGRIADFNTMNCPRKNIGITGDKITYIGHELISGKKIINAEGRYILPGFIDIHSHVDGDEYAGMLSVCQGITTTIGGNCGLSPESLSDYFRRDKKGFYMNELMFTGHSFTMREQVGLTGPYQPADDKEIEQMLARAKQDLEDGACGISFGLDYAPGSSIKELRQLAALCASYGKVMAVHTRLFTDKDLNSLYEVINIAKSTGVRMVVSHFVYQYGNGCMQEALHIVKRARQQGIDVYIDSGMYTDWSTYVGTESYSPDVILDNGYVLGDFVVATGIYAGQRMTRDIYEDLRENYPEVSVICFTGKQEEIYMALKEDFAMPSTDAGAYAKGEGHPQIAGTYAKYFIEMVRERGDLTVAQASYKASALPADIFGLASKGRLEVGKDADIVMMDLENLTDRAVFPHLGLPDAVPIGFDMVMVSGNIVAKDGMLTGKPSGHCLKQGA